MIKILLLGEAGFLGQKLAPLLEKNSSFNVTSILNKRQPKVLRDFEYFWYDNFINNEDPHSYDIIINLATKYARKNIIIDQILETNVQMPLRILSKLNDKEMLVITGDTFYSKYPQKVNNCVYTFSKYCFSQLVKMKFQNIRLVNLRIEHMYGEDDSIEKFIPYVFRHLKFEDYLPLTNCLHKRDFIHVEDVASSIYHLIKQHKNIVNKSNIVEVGQGFSISLKEMIYVASEISNSRCELKFGSLELEDDLINDSFAQKSYLLREWRPKYSLKEGLTKCLNAKNVHY